MADEETKPETEETPDTISDELETASSEDGAGDTSTAGGTPAEPQEVLPPKERRARRRAATPPTARGPLTPEQRDEERRARRAQKAKLRRSYRQREKAKA